MSNSKTHNIFNDTPITYPRLGNKGLEKNIEERDNLGTQDYARALAEFVKTCETPMTIGLQGDWGIGKTSMLNMIKAYLEGAQNAPYGIIWFNTWHYSLFGQEEYLGLAVIKGLLDQIKAQFNINENENKFKEVAGKIGNVLKHARFSAFGFGVSASDAKAHDDSPEAQVEYQDVSSVMLKFKESFQELVNFVTENNHFDKLVFFIDDLDRVKPIKALELLESIKNFLDVENCVFLLAVDYEIVQIGMAEKLGQDLQKISGKSFFDKIIQLPFTMPSTSYDLGNYIRTLLVNTDFSVKDHDVEFYEEVTSCTVGRNPRSIKRIINYSKLIRLIRGRHSSSKTKDSDLQRKILYALLCMQVAWPEIFNYFVKSPTPATIKNIEDWEFLDKIPFIDKLYDRTPNLDQLKSNVSAYFDLFYDLLDSDNDGHISQKELAPVHDILRVARLASTSDFKQPTDTFFEFLVTNDVGNKFSKIVGLFKKSKWITSGKFEYRMSGKRYVTIVHNRKQIGSLVTLKTSPFIFRIQIDELALEEYLAPIFVDSIDIDKVIKAVESESLTGFGDTMIDLSELLAVDDKSIQKLFNRLFEYVIGTAK
ncbi:MAG: hypothetical protein HN936_07285 [Bacteroidetes bacterium]|nr:hypothetical protein [Candidatus Neomarinimicrobiota bacterium]MBT7093032.1 hypothetical protein [Bacteroidota bacterium]